MSIDFAKYISDTFFLNKNKQKTNVNYQSIEESISKNTILAMNSNESEDMKIEETGAEIKFDED